MNFSMAAMFVIVPVMGMVMRVIMIMILVIMVLVVMMPGIGSVGAVALGGRMFRGLMALLAFR